MTRIEQIQQALSRAQAANDTEAVAVIQGMLDEERGSQILREAPGALLPSGTLAPLPQDPSVPVPPSTTARVAEVAGTGILDQLQQAGGFLGSTFVDPVQNAIEWAEAGLVGREPRYRNRAEESRQISQNLQQGLGELSTGEQIAFGAGSAVGMIPETLVGGGLVRQGSKAGAALLNEGAETAAQFALRQTQEGIGATSLLAPRLGAQTAAEAEAAGATPFEAALAGAADTLGTALTAGLPISARGNLAQRAVTGAVGGLAAEAGASAVVTPFLPDELAAQRNILNPENATMAAVLGAGMGAAFGTRPGQTGRASQMEAQRMANELQESRLAEVAAKDAEIARGMQAAQEQPAVAQAERAIAELMTRLPEGGLDLETRRGEASTLLNTEALPQEPAGPSSPFLPRSERVNLERTRGESSTLLNVPDDTVATPRGPVSLMEGQTPETGLALDTPRGEATPLQGPEAERARFEAQRVDAETNIAFLTEEKARLQQEPQTRQTRVQIQQIDRQIGTQAIRRAVAVKAIEQPTQQAVTPEVTPVEPTNTLTRPFTLRPAEPVQGAPATTPAPRTQTAPTRAERAVAPPARTVAEQTFDPTTGRMETVVEEAVAPEDKARQDLESFFSAPRTEPLPAQEVNKVNEMADVQAIITNPDPQANIVPREQRKPSAFEARMNGVVNARGTLEVIRGMATPNSPFSRVLDALEKSPFLDDVPVRIVQPEDALPRNLKKPTTRGIMQPYKGGKNAVFLRGSGFKLNGTFTPEIALHEIVHAATADLVNAVQTGRVKDAAAVAAVKQIEALRTEMKKALETRETREGLTASEKVALDYAGKNTDEFIAQALSSTDMQKGLKKEGLWKKLVNIVRTMFRGPRSTAPLWENILDASLSVIDAQSRAEGEVRSARALREAEETAKASPMDMDGELDFDAAEADIRDTSEATAREQVLGNDRTLRDRMIRKTSPLTRTGRIARDFNHFLDRIFSSTRGATRSVREVMGMRDGLVERVDAEVARIVNRLQADLRLKVPKGMQEAAAKQMNDVLLGKLDLADATLLTRGTRVNLQKARDTIDNLSQTIGKEVVRSYEGRDMPQSAINTLKTIKNQMGKYVARTYLSSTEKGFANDLWSRYKDKDPSAVDIVQPLMDRMTGEIASLGEFLTNAKEEAKALGKDFEGADTLVGSELRRLYENLIGSSAGRTKQEMFSGLEKFSKETKDVVLEAERVVQEIMGVGEGMSQLADYYRGLRTADQPLRKRSAVPEDIRKVWGEIQDPVLNVINTTMRMGALLSNLKLSNSLAEQSPELFADRYEAESGRTMQIPNNPIAYGKLAGKYTDSGVHSLIVGEVEMVSSLLYGKPLDPAKFGRVVGQGVLTTVGSLTKAQKMMSIVTNPFVAMSNVLNLAFMPLVNGNTNMKALPQAIKIASDLVGTGFRTTEANPLALEVLEMGLIDPVLTQAVEVVNQRKKEAQASRRNRVIGRTGADKAISVMGTSWGTFKEAVSFLETLPKIWNYLYHKEALKKVHPELSPDALNRLAAEVTNRLNLTYSRVPDLVKGTEMLGVSYVAGYMQQVAATSVHSISSGARQAVEGMRSGNKELALYGMKKVSGSMTGFALASYFIPMAVSELMGWTDATDEEDEEGQAFRDTIPFLERGSQPMITNITPEGIVTYTDIGRLNPYDSMHAPVRALSRSLGAIAQGDMTKAEDELKGAIANFQGQFFGGSPIGEMALRTIRGKPPVASARNDARDLHDGMQEAFAYVGVPRDVTSAMVNGLWMWVPAPVKGLTKAEQLQDENPEAFGANLLTAATVLRAPVRNLDPFLNVERAAQFAYKTDSTASRDNLRALLLSTSEITPETVSGALQELVNDEAEAFNELNKSVLAARYVGRQINESESTTRSRIEESLNNAKIGKDKARAIAQGNIDYKPTLIGPTWGEEILQGELRNLAATTSREYRARRQKELEERLALIRSELEKVQPTRRTN